MRAPDSSLVPQQPLIRTALSSSCEHGTLCQLLETPFLFSLSPNTAVSFLGPVEVCCGHTNGFLSFPGSHIWCSRRSHKPGWAVLGGWTWATAACLYACPTLARGRSVDTLGQVGD